MMFFHSPPKQAGKWGIEVYWSVVVVEVALMTGDEIEVEEIIFNLFKEVQPLQKSEKSRRIDAYLYEIPNSM